MQRQRAKSVFTDGAKKTPKCSLFRLEHPGTKIASYIILNENQSPLSGPEVETDLSACFLGGEKRHAEQRAPPTGKRPKAAQTYTQKQQQQQHPERQRNSFRWPA